jgi:hypothetical protein
LGGKSVRGNAPISRAEFFRWKDNLSDSALVFYMCLYQWARHSGKHRGKVLTSRKELFEKFGRSGEKCSMDQIDDLLDQCKKAGAIGIEMSLRGRPSGTRPRLIIKLLRYQTAAQASVDAEPENVPEQSDIPATEMSASQRTLSDNIGQPADITAETSAAQPTLPGLCHLPSTACKAVISENINKGEEGKASPVLGYEASQPSPQTGDAVRPAIREENSVLDQVLDHFKAKYAKRYTAAPVVADRELEALATAIAEQPQASPTDWAAWMENGFDIAASRKYPFETGSMTLRAFASRYRDLVTERPHQASATEIAAARAHEAEMLALTGDARREAEYREPCQPRWKKGMGQIMWEHNLIDEEREVYDRAIRGMNSSTLEENRAAFYLGIAAVKEWRRTHGPIEAMLR